MIPYADFEMALARWQARKAGTPMASEEIPSGAVAAEVPVPNAEPYPEATVQAVSSEEAPKVPSSGSGLINISESDAPTPGPESIEE
jgi:hypothetical protein